MSRVPGLGREAVPRRGEKKPALFQTKRGLLFTLLSGIFVVGAFWTMRMRGLVLALAVMGVVSIVAGMKRMLARLSGSQPPSVDAPADAVKPLKRALARSQYLDAIDPALAEKALSQFEQNEDRFAKFRSVLAAKFERHELTYERYFAVAEQLHQAVHDNLSDVSVMLANLNSLAVREARKELGLLERFAQLTEDEVRTAEGLRERLAIAEKTEAEIRSRLAYNENALTELDRVNWALSSIKTSKNAPPIDLETTMTELRELAERAKKYSL